MVCLIFFLPSLNDYLKIGKTPWAYYDDPLEFAVAYHFPGFFRGSASVGEAPSRAAATQCSMLRRAPSTSATSCKHSSDIRRGRGIGPQNVVILVILDLY